MKIIELLQKNRNEIINIAKSHGAYQLRVFGSVAKGEAHINSDVDFLVDMESDRSLLDLGGLQFDLQEFLHIKVDVVTEKGLRHRIREKVLQEAVPL